MWTNTVSKSLIQVAIKINDYFNEWEDAQSLVFGFLNEVKEQDAQSLVFGFLNEVKEQLRATFF